MQQHRRLDRVAAGEGNAVEQLPARRHLPRQRLGEGRELGIEGAEQRPGRQLGHAAAAERSVGRLARERPPEAALDELDALLDQERPEQAADEVRLEAAGVGVHEDHDLAPGHRQRTPHGVALAEGAAELRHELRLLVHLGPQRPRQLAGPVLRRSVDHEHLIHEPGAGERLHDRADGVRHLARGQHHRDLLVLPFAQQLERIGGVVKGPGIMRAYYGRWCPPHRPPAPGTPYWSRAQTTAAWPRPGGRRRWPDGMTELPEDLHPALLEGLERAGIEQLWSHQAEAFEAAREGPVIVTTRVPAPIPTMTISTTTHPRRPARTPERAPDRCGKKTRSDSMASSTATLSCSTSASAGTSACAGCQPAGDWRLHIDPGSAQRQFPVE